MDLVYIYKRDPKDKDENEIRFSLRSACRHLKFGRAYVIGDLPAFASAELVHVPHAGPKDKYQNACSRILRAASDPRISEEFLLMNNDFVLLRDYDPVPYYHMGTIGRWLRERPKQLRQRYHMIGECTANAVGRRAPTYAVHFPFRMKKREVLKMAARYKLPHFVYHLRTLYAKFAGVEGERHDDMKARSPGELLRLLQRAEFLSTTDDVGKGGLFRQKMLELFPDKCRFEK